MKNGPSLLDYLRNPQAHSEVSRASAASRVPRRSMPSWPAATLPRRYPPAPQQAMGLGGYMSMLEDPQPEPAPVMAFRDASGMDPRPVRDEQFDQWMSRTGPRQRLLPDELMHRVMPPALAFPTFPNGPTNEDVVPPPPSDGKFSPAELRAARAELIAETHGRGDVTDLMVRNVAESRRLGLRRAGAPLDAPSSLPEGISWTEANAIARRARAQANAPRPGLLAGIERLVPFRQRTIEPDPALARFMASRRPITRPE